MRHRSTRRALVVALAVAGLVAAPATQAAADAVRDTQWHLRYLNVAEAHRHSLGDGVIVAVLDSGVDANHPDLADRVLPAVSAVGDEAAAQTDPDGRGTALAGLVAGHGHGPDSGEGALGIAPNAKILPVVITGAVDGGKNPNAEPDAMAKGIQLAVQRGAKVICVGRNVPSSDLLREAVAEALRANVVVVSVDGERPREEFGSFPAAYPGVIAAAPMGRDQVVTVTSKSGRVLALAVPGVEITSTNTRSGYRIDNGGAAGILAGAVALVRARFPALPVDEVVNRLTATAVDAGASGRDDVYGNGRLSLLAALTADVPLLHPGPSAAASAIPVPTPREAKPAGEAGQSRGPLGWLVLLPLVAVLGALGWYALRAERRIPARPRPEPAPMRPAEPAEPSAK
jgi:subtilisin family serine protease